MKKTKIIYSFILLAAFALFISPFAFAEEKPAQQPMININTASLEELQQLDKVGPKYAQRIIDYREKVGKFTKPEDIMKVEGIGQKVFDANKDKITVK